MAGRVAHLISIVIITAELAGCGTSAKSQYYSLDSTAIPDGRPASRAAVMVGPVSVPASVDQPQIVVQVAPNRVEVEEFNRWVAPLNDSIARTVAGDLATLLGTPDVATTQLANFNPDYRVTIDVQRFDSIRGKEALLEAVWSVRKTAGGDSHSGRTVAREAVQGDGFEVLAAAHSRALARMSGDIAAVIRTEAEEKP
ncbi:MAG: PqiC family protein [Candidatus Binatus sp.]|uniref:PqiC family protein n=1 Tax=Candidatus Binatus sp. TaxID=2811406 RepID=UPI002716908B|nr:PqiC family protein [Candidatus Binatus sp.]MDO8433466.1 PqiC family protein [Candidatus Binatus sp.]